MTISSIQTEFAGQENVLPRRGKMVCNDTLSQITYAGFLNGVVNNGGNPLNTGDFLDTMYGPLSNTPVELIVSIVSGVVTASVYDPNANNVITVPHGGTGRATLAQYGVLIGNLTSPIVSTQMTNGQLLVGSTGSQPVAVVPTSSDSTVSITGGAGTLDFKVANPPYILTTLTGSQTISNSSATTPPLQIWLLTSGGSGTTVTLPASPKVGETHRFINMINPGWTISAGAKTIAGLLVAATNYVGGNINVTTIAAPGVSTIHTQDAVSALYQNLEIMWDGTYWMLLSNIGWQ